jgi:hypothetical protein
LVKEGLYHGTLMTITLALAATSVMADLILNAEKIDAAVLAEMKNAISATADSPAAPQRIRIALG